MTAYKDATKCYYCEASFSYSVIKTKDHIIPRSKGGGGGDNIVAACKHCNGNKGSLSLDEFFNKMLTRRNRNGNQHANIDLILQNIAKLKVYVQSLSLATKKPEKEEWQLRDWPIFEKSIIKEVNEIVREPENLEPLFRERIVKLVNLRVKPAGNFHEEFVNDGIIY